MPPVSRSLFAALALAVACAGGGRSREAESGRRLGRIQEIHCGDLSRLQFQYTQPSLPEQSLAGAVSPWRRTERVWLGPPTGLGGKDLASLRVIETPQHVFGPGERFAPGRDAPLVPAIELRFLGPSGQRFREIERELDEEQRRDLLRSRGLAIVLDGRLFLAPSIFFIDRGPEPEVIDTIELKDEPFDEIVEVLERGLDCPHPDLRSC